MVSRCSDGEVTVLAFMFLGLVNFLLAGGYDVVLAMSVPFGGDGDLWPVPCPWRRSLSFSSPAGVGYSSESSTPLSIKRPS